MRDRPNINTCYKSNATNVSPLSCDVTGIVSFHPEVRLLSSKDGSSERCHRKALNNGKKIQADPIPLKLAIESSKNEMSIELADQILLAALGSLVVE